MAKAIALTQGKVAIVDDEDFEYLMQWKWLYALGYARRSDGGRRNPHNVFMHRVIMNTPDGLYTDHINGNKLDNRKCNLRICTNRENQMNVRTKHGTSKFKGVHWHKKDQRWRATINNGVKQVHLGNFVKEVDAALAYDKAAREMFGEFAAANFGNESVSPTPDVKPTIIISKRINPKPTRPLQPIECIEPDCDRKPRAHGLCDKHYQRQRAKERGYWRKPKEVTIE